MEGSSDICALKTCCYVLFLTVIKARNNTVVSFDGKNELVYTALGGSGQVGERKNVQWHQAVETLLK